MPRGFGAGGFMSSRMAERMAAIASSWSESFLSIRASSCAKRRASSLFDPSNPRSCTKAREGAHDLNVDRDRAVAVDHGRQHGNTLFGEGVGQILAVRAAAWLALRKIVVPVV